MRIATCTTTRRINLKFNFLDNSRRNNGTEKTKRYNPKNRKPPNLSVSFPYTAYPTLKKEQ